VKFLVDAQLPPRLVAWLVSRGERARHVAALPDGLRMPDAEIWAEAGSAGEAIVTKDFLDFAAVRGSPPAVLLLAVGNASNRDLLERLEASWPVLLDELARPDACVVILERERVVVQRRA
jgi:predicted nuclease of predicted toxin-antitoxin system